MSWLRNSADKAITAKLQAEEIHGDPGSVTVLEKPVQIGPRKPLSLMDTSKYDAAQIKEYRETCEAVGIDPTDIQIEEFRHFLAQKDMPTFDLESVVAYMDELVVTDNPTGFGWHWSPVRHKDTEFPMQWGKPSTHHRGGWTGFSREEEPERKIPASDYYQSHGFHREDQNSRSWNGGVVTHSGMVTTPQTAAEVMQHEIDSGFRLRSEITAFWSHPRPVYTRPLPLHALKKIATIEREFPHRVVFLVTDYTTRAFKTVNPNPDPFLMAVIPNIGVSHGKGRFIIDVWDEPGFGLDKKLGL